MIINVELGISGTPVDFTGVVDYPAIGSVIIEIVNDDDLRGLAQVASNSDNSAILNATILQFLGFTNDLGTLLPIPDEWNKETIIEALKDRPTIENTIVVRILAQASEALAFGEDDDNVFGMINNLISDKVGIMSELPVGQFFTELLELDNISYKE